ncbi:hypothetical protein [Pedobacter sp. WC2423]|uniref:hypothetical protein n=1 Tax=Pedobacter sp. WC2423 TaxID=3234142 RepID=UPI0034676455
MPEVPRFRRVLIKPALAKLTKTSRTIPSPEGIISVKLKRKGKSGINARLRLPKVVMGTFIWDDKRYTSHEGSQRLNLFQ